MHPEKGATMARYRTRIVYDREVQEFAMYLDGELVGFARTPREAEDTLDQLIGELTNDQYLREAA
jgi:hypothetical protein